MTKSVNTAAFSGLAAQLAEMTKGVNFGAAAQLVEMTKGVNTTAFSGLAAQLAEMAKGVNAGLAAQIDEMVGSLESGIAVDWDRLLVSVTSGEEFDVLSEDDDAVLGIREQADARAAAAIGLVCLVVLLRAGQVHEGLAVIRMLIDLLAYEIDRSLTIQGILYLSGIIGIVTTVVKAATGRPNQAGQRDEFDPPTS